MEIIGFRYDNTEQKIEAFGRPIPRELADKGFVQKDNADGIPRWYVMPTKVFILVEDNGKRVKYDIYKNIMALYPARQKMSLKLAQDAIAKLFTGEIEFYLRDGEPFLVWNEKKSKKRPSKKK